MGVSWGWGVLMPGLQGTMKVPGLGEVKKTHLAVAGAAVVGIVGVGYYRKRQQAAIPVTSTQTSTDAFGDTTPTGPGGSNGVTNQFGDPVPAPIVQSPNPGIITNQDWLSAAESLNLGGIPSDSINAACSRILGGLSVTSAQADIYHQVVGIIGPPPQSAPTIKITSTPPPPGAPKVTVTYPVGVAQLGQKTNARGLIQQHSPGATATEVEVALRRTVADPRNAHYVPYYRSSRGYWPFQAKIYYTYVKRTTAAA
jgi:hypothetical protein